ncbi:alpha/beta fold hydrolase [Candidatus Viridilinea mediisalina]|uniref:Alpha/beta hydrolase n=1 Tax=Candidatus Viridilinea mediisalina TaxID=2024553 RepID=A0A2A6RD19_9CHLR|nr:alpha/beta fold hydrolase [Candidatus Viridilinea mediisalina]PDV99622.1 alpha/beta hydrolase [Candidatus Viridilinea mediisalina]
MQIHLNGIKLNYHEEGSGPAIVMLHAFPLAGAMWHTQVALLREQYRVIVPDLRGFGGSEAPPGPYLMDTMADDVAALLTQLGIAQSAVIGLSMGGYIAFSLWRRHRQLLSALVLADTRAAPDNTEGQAAREANARLVEEAGPPAIATKMIPNLVAPSASQALRDELSRLIHANSSQGIAGALRGMALRPDSRPDLGSINIPTLVIVGTEDSLTPPAEAEAMHHALPNSTLVQIEGAGHLSNLEQPTAFNSALQSFFAA